MDTINIGGRLNTQSVNELIQQANQASNNILGMMQQQTALQRKSEMSSFPAMITGSWGDGRYEWIEVERQIDSAGNMIKWNKNGREGRMSQVITGDTPRVPIDEKAPRVLSDEENYDTLNEPQLVHPAVEVNGRCDVIIGSIQILTPMAIRTNEFGYLTNEMSFSSAPMLRLFEVSEDLIPRKGESGGEEAGEDEYVQNPYIVKGFFVVDKDKKSFNLPPKEGEEKEDPKIWDFYLPTTHRYIEAPEDATVNFGVARKSSGYQAGTKGWAVWCDDAWETEVEENGEPVTRGQWQIVHLNGDDQYYIKLYGTSSILNLASGEAEIWWMDCDNLQDESTVFKNSNYRISINNYTGSTLIPDVLYVAWFDRYEYRWKVFPHAPYSRMGKLAGELEAGGSATVNVWSYRAGSVQATDPLEQVTVYDWLLASGDSIAEGTKVFFELKSDGHWYVYASECVED